jgi:two-component sensor histidine kinase
MPKKPPASSNARSGSNLSWKTLVGALTPVAGRDRGAIGERVSSRGLVRSAAMLLLGAAAGGASLLLRYGLVPVLGVDEPFLPLFPLILLSTLAGGAWAGAACLVVGVLGAWYLFMGRPFSFVLAPHELGGLVGALLAGLIILLMCQALVRLLARATAAARHEEIIAREFEHRMRNTLTLVLAISRRTFSPGRPLGEAQREFEGRLRALSEAHAAVLAASGEGAELRTVVAQILAPFGFAAGDHRLTIKGPDVRLGPAAATGIALALHELSTNAVKYGALSAPAGKVVVEWRLAEGDPPELRLTWRESGGPVVVEPRKRGFGSQLIERNLAQALGGTAKLQFAPDGLRAEIAARLQ